MNRERDFPAVYNRFAYTDPNGVVTESCMPQHAAQTTRDQRRPA